MNEPRQLAPGIAEDDKVVLYDGVCKLCSAWVRFLIRFDRQQRFLLAPVQSKEGQAILAWYGLSTEVFDTMLLLEGPRLFTKSTAVLRVLWRLPMPWSSLAIVWLVPWFIRDWAYQGIALNRYALFGRHDHCELPEADHAKRFLR